MWLPESIDRRVVTANLRPNLTPPKSWMRLPEPRDRRVVTGVGLTLLLSGVSFPLSPLWQPNDVKSLLRRAQAFEAVEK